MSDPFAGAAARLMAAAQTLAAARIEQLRLARREPAAVWRKARLLWPRFTKG